VYLLNLPSAYKIFVPAGLCAVIAMIAQRLYYNTTTVSRIFIAWLIIIALGGLVTYHFQVIQPLSVGLICGWVSTSLFAIYQLPQVVRVYRTQSVHGLSFLFILTLGIGTALEFFASLVLNLPLPSLLSGLRGIIIYSFFCWQFLLHWDK
jgi:uncharacterized protein with PQ loop repeat